MRNTTAGHFTPHTSPEEYREMLEGDELVAGTDQVLFPCAHTFQNDILRWYIENGVPTRKPCMFCKNPWSNQSSISTLQQPDAESMARFWETHAPPSVAFKVFRSFPSFMAMCVFLCCRRCIYLGAEAPRSLCGLTHSSPIG